MGDKGFMALSTGAAESVENFGGKASSLVTVEVHSHVGAVTMHVSPEVLLNASGIEEEERKTLLKEFSRVSTSLLPRDTQATFHRLSEKLRACVRANSNALINGLMPLESVKKVIDSYETVKTEWQEKVEWVAKNWDSLTTSYKERCEALFDRVCPSEKVTLMKRVQRTLITKEEWVKRTHLDLDMTGHPDLSILDEGDKKAVEALMAETAKRGVLAQGIGLMRETLLSLNDYRKVVIDRLNNRLTINAATKAKLRSAADKLRLLNCDLELETVSRCVDLMVEAAEEPNGELSLCAVEEAMGLAYGFSAEAGLLPDLGITAEELGVDEEDLLSVYQNL